LNLTERAKHTHVILLHHPILNKNGEVVTTAVTNLDIHDISRASKTYGLTSYHIVTPIFLQRKLVNKIIGHWKDGWGATHNPNRAEAFLMTNVDETLEDAIQSITEVEGEPPLIVATSARDMEGNSFSYKELRESEKPIVLIFGTGWGIAPEGEKSVDGFLPPIKGPVDYNHLSVRSAVSITLDRFLGA
jgi:hypothetical protein